MIKTKSELRKLLSNNKISESDIQNTVNHVYSPCFRYFTQYNPKISLESVKCPVLAVNGAKDIQVIVEENLSGIEASLQKAANQNYEMKLVKNKNDLFQTTLKFGIDE